MATQYETGDHDRQTTGSMERVTFRATEAQLGALGELVDAGLFPNRSAAIRAAVRQLVADETDLRGHTDE
ncbi:ribbon-helix-helix domain-containing protein [Natrinema versiforme]|uniref:CopG-like domain-containing protein DNA-binding domain n=1 Tax=Natrinema versiforme JCM 10478 TaxID=1227496 RepID=L9Y4A9_9EURY|nr:ribbon-helix-helix domain-containing protein [Natrinema versiforme]ELY68905.1 CopG-like domain-containing protein DNA-binding domain [Natrinema versiforme JCM 10478]